MTLGFLSGSKNFCKLLCFSREVFVLHGNDWIHWVAKSCTTTAYRWLFRDSQFSLRTLWSAVIKSPKISARSTAPPMRLLHGTLVILVLWQISQLPSSGMWYKHCAYPIPLLLAVLKVFREKNWKRLGVLEHFHPPDRAWTPVAFLTDYATSFLVQPRCRHFYMGFRFLLVHACDRFPCTSSLVPSPLLDAGYSVGVTVSCDEDVREVGEDEVEELVDGPGTTRCTWFAVLQLIFLPFLMRCGFWPLVQW